VTTNGPGTVRDARPGDAARCAEIYAPYVRDDRVGWKHGRWHDVAWYQRDLATDWSPPG
jgi:L-amino acid N-acyltransferase YncA